MYKRWNLFSNKLILPKPGRGFSLVTSKHSIACAVKILVLSNMVVILPTDTAYRICTAQSLNNSVRNSETTPFLTWKSRKLKPSKCNVPTVSGKGLTQSILTDHVT